MPAATQWRRPVSQDPPDGMGARPPALGDVADGGDLTQVEGRVLDLQVDNELAQAWREGGPVLALFDWREQAEQAKLVEPLDLAMERARRHAGVPRAFGRRLAEEHAGAHDLVGTLLRPLHEERELLPVVRRCDLGASLDRHRGLRLALCRLRRAPPPRRGRAR
jgi:hypothetical protein